MQQLNLSGLPDIPIRVFVFVVFALSTWASLASGWIGLGYMFSNYFVVLLGIWTERDSSEAVPVQLLFFGLLFTFLNDILSISITYERAIDSVEGWAAGTSNVRFNAAMVIILIILKPLIGLFVYKEWQKRHTGGGHPNTSQYEAFGGQQPPMRDEYAPYDHKAAPPHYQSANNQPFP